MASAQIGGQYSIYVANPAGVQKLVYSAAAYWWGPGGSSVGVIANTPEKWNYLPLSPWKGGSGYRIIVTLSAGAAATSDASDGVWIVPLLVNGQAQTFGNIAAAGGLGNSNFTGELTPGDNAYVAGVETPIQIIRAKEGVNFQLGGGRVFLSIEDNA